MHKRTECCTSSGNANLCWPQTSCLEERRHTAGSAIDSFLSRLPASLTSALLSAKESEMLAAARACCAWLQDANRRFDREV